MTGFKESSAKILFPFFDIGDFGRLDGQGVPTLFNHGGPHSGWNIDLHGMGG